MPGIPRVVRTHACRCPKQAGRTIAMMVPNTQDLMQEVMTSQAVRALTAESMMTLALTSYTSSASTALAAMPAPIPTSNDALCIDCESCSRCLLHGLAMKLCPKGTNRQAYQSFYTSTVVNVT